MKKRAIISVAISIVAMFLIPFLAVNFIYASDALGVLLLLMFVLNPIISIVIGIISGSDKVMWYLPVINAIIFLISESIIAGFDISYIIAAAVYTVIGLAAAYIKGRRKNNAAG